MTNIYSLKSSHLIQNIRNMNESHRGNLPKWLHLYFYPNAVESARLRCGSHPCFSDLVDVNHPAGLMKMQVLVVGEPGGPVLLTCSRMMLVMLDGGPRPQGSEEPSPWLEHVRVAMRTLSNDIYVKWHTQHLAWCGNTLTKYFSPSQSVSILILTGLS